MNRHINEDGAVLDIQVDNVVLEALDCQHEKMVFGGTTDSNTVFRICEKCGKIEDV